VADPVRTFEFTVAGWTWVFKLFQYELVVDGRSENARQHLRFQLRECDDYPQRQVSSLWLPPPHRFWITLPLIALLVFAFFGVLAFVTVRFHFPQNDLVGMFLLWIGVCGGVLLCAYFVLRSCRIGRVRRRVMFRRVSDGSPYFYITHIADAPTDDIELIQFNRRIRAWKTDPTSKPSDEFECFVCDVVASIKRIREEDRHDDAGPSTSITATPK
jgi:hypothetical protein